MKYIKLKKEKNVNVNNKFIQSTSRSISAASLSHCKNAFLRDNLQKSPLCDRSHRSLAEFQAKGNPLMSRKYLITSIEVIFASSPF